MPDARLQRTKATLPEGYQFGDAAQAKQAHCPHVWGWNVTTDAYTCGHCGAQVSQVDIKFRSRAERADILHS